MTQKSRQKNAKKRINLRVRPEFAKAVARYCKDEDTSVSHVARTAFKLVIPAHYFEKKKVAA